MRLYCLIFTYLILAAPYCPGETDWYPLLEEAYRLKNPSVVDSFFRRWERTAEPIEPVLIEDLEMMAAIAEIYLMLLQDEANPDGEYIVLQKTIRVSRTPNQKWELIGYAPPGLPPSLNILFEDDKFLHAASAFIEAPFKSEDKNFQADDERNPYVAARERQHFLKNALVFRADIGGGIAAAFPGAYYIHFDEKMYSATVLFYGGCGLNQKRFVQQGLHWVRESSKPKPEAKPMEGNSLEELFE